MSGIVLASGDNDIKDAVTAALAGSGQAVARTVVTGTEAVSACRSLSPEMLLLDVNLTGPDAPTTVRQVMREAPCPILLVAANVSGRAARVFDALAQGAMDTVRPPFFGTNGSLIGTDDFLRKLMAVRSAAARTNSNAARHQLRTGGRRIVAIGSSTGGPKALADILAGLPSDLPAPVVIVQHLDERFADGLAEWLSGRTALSVRSAVAGEPFRPGRVYIAKTNDHLVIGPDLLPAYVREPADYPYRPSVDEFFRSLARHWPVPSLAVILTGMGKDGALGMLELRRRGWRTLAQDEQSSVVYGMPKAAAENGAAGEILHLNGMSEAIVKYFQEK